MTDSIAKMRAHAMHRLWQRKGLALTGREYIDLCADVCARQHERIAEGYGGRIFVPVKYRGAKVLAVFDTQHCVIVSFVPQVPPYTARRVEAVAV